MADVHRQIPGGPFVNETGSRQAQIPGGPYLNELAPVTGALSATEGADTAAFIGTVSSGAKQQQTGGRPSKGKKPRRRRVLVDGELYEVPERDLPALLEAKLLNKRPPRTAEVVEIESPGEVESEEVEAEERSEYPSLEEAQDRYDEMVRQLNAQADEDMRRLLDAVAARVLSQMMDEEDALSVLLMG